MVSIAVGLKASSTLQREVMLADTTLVDKRITEKETNIKISMCKIFLIEYLDEAVSINLIGQVHTFVY